LFRVLPTGSCRCRRRMREDCRQPQAAARMKTPLSRLCPSHASPFANRRRHRQTSRIIRHLQKPKRARCLSVDAQRIKAIWPSCKTEWRRSAPGWPTAERFCQACGRDTNTVDRRGGTNRALIAGCRRFGNRPPPGIVGKAESALGRDRSRRAQTGYESAICSAIRRANRAACYADSLRRSFRIAKRSTKAAPNLSIRVAALILEINIHGDEPTRVSAHNEMNPPSRNRRLCPHTTCAA